MGIRFADEGVRLSHEGRERASWACLVLAADLFDLADAMEATR